MVVMFVLGRWFTSGLMPPGHTCSAVRERPIFQMNKNLWLGYRIRSKKILNIQGLNLCQFYAITQWQNILTEIHFVQENI